MTIVPAGPAPWPGLQTRILDSYEREDGYWWMSFQPDLLINNWNPWCNANCLSVLLLTEEKAERGAALIHKALRSLDRFIASYEEDGGCDEGPAYWVRAAASLYDALQAHCMAPRAVRLMYSMSRKSGIWQLIFSICISAGMRMSTSPIRRRESLCPPA